MKIKYAALAVLLLLAVVYPYAQPPRDHHQYKQVIMDHVTDWGNTSFMIAPEYWTDEVKQQFLQQMPEEAYEKIKTFSKAELIPCSMRIWCNDDRPKKNSDSLYEKMSRLKIFKVAKYMYTMPDGRQIPYAAFCVPYTGNEEVFEDASWDTLYYIIPDKFLVDAAPGLSSKKAPAPNYPAMQVKTMKNAIYKIDPNSDFWYEQDRRVNIIRQVGAENGTKISVFYTLGRYNEPFLPAAFKDSKTQDEEISKLKTYKVAEFIKWESSGKPKKYYVLRVPYSLNKDWNPSAVWDKRKSDLVFFMLPAEDVKETGGEPLTSFSAL